MVLYIRDPKNSTRELLNLINSFSEVAEYKINSNKSMAFLYTKNKQAEKEIRETTPFSIVTNNIKYFALTLTKEVKDLYDKNFKSLKHGFLTGTGVTAQKDVHRNKRDAHLLKQGHDAKTGN